MPEYRLSSRADRDVKAILHYSAANWGDAVAARYQVKLEGCLDRLAMRPALGHVYNGRTRCMRFTCDRHVIFYQASANGVFVLRVLHDSMDPPRHL